MMKKKDNIPSIDLSEISELQFGQSGTGRPSSTYQDIFLFIGPKIESQNKTYEIPLANLDKINLEELKNKEVLVTIIKGQENGKTTKYRVFDDITITNTSLIVVISDYCLQLLLDKKAEFLQK